MYPSRIMVSSRKTAQGSMLVIAIFVILVMAFLGITMVQMLSATSQSVVYEVLGTRALNAAQAGLQKIAANAFPINGGIVSCDDLVLPVQSNANFGQIAGFENCSYSARCTTTEIVKDGQLNNFYRFSSEGVCQSGDVWVSRSVAIDALQEI